MRFIPVGVVVLALLLGSQLSGTPDRSARAAKLTVKEMCRGPSRPEWCSEYYADLAHGREVRKQLEREDRKAVEDQSYDELQQSHREGFE